ncbi:MAG: hypothetical protein M3433_01225 [Actinomycetota bacterium]|nr:hypothetical protein [Actinomycetota bacterium]
MDKHDEGAVVPFERLQAAMQERDRIRDEHEAARGSSGELAAAVELEAAEQQVGAREAWQRYVGRHDGV